jgi:RNA polymerase sigma-70 factor (ECF subfamily)
VDFFTFDTTYVEKLRCGDVPTQEHFVGYFSELIQMKLRMRLASQEAIDDVKQETFRRVLSILGKDGGLRQAERLGPFVNTVCNHVLMEQYRAQGKRASALEDESEDIFVDHGPSPLSVLESKEASRIVQHTLVAMPERDRDLLRAVLMEERDKDEICAELGVNREYLRVLVHRAKQSFKTFYLARAGE